MSDFAISTALHLLTASTNTRATEHVEMAQSVWEIKNLKKFL
jgi:hypothetical protein